MKNYISLNMVNSSTCKISSDKISKIIVKITWYIVYVVVHIVIFDKCLQNDQLIGGYKRAVYHQNNTFFHNKY